MSFFSASVVHDKVAELEYGVPPVIGLLGEEARNGGLFEVVSLEELLTFAGEDDAEYDDVPIRLDDIFHSISVNDIEDDGDEEDYADRPIRVDDIFHAISVNDIEEEEEEFIFDKKALAEISSKKASRLTTPITDIFEVVDVSELLDTAIERDNGKYYTSSEIDQLVEENMGLVFSCVNSFKVDNSLREELISVGQAALVKGLGKIDKSKNNKNSTYLVPCIRNNIINFLDSYKGNPLTYAVSYDVPIEGGSSCDNMTLLDNYAFKNNDYTPSAEEMFFSRERARRIRNCLIILTPVENYIITHSYGINDVEIYTQKDLGAVMHLSQPQISQIKNRAFSKLRRVITNLMKAGKW